MFDHTTIGLGALLIVAGLALAPGASAAAGDLVIAEDHERVTDSTGTPTTDGGGECGGLAPVETACSTGTWTQRGGILHGILASDHVPTYVLESRLVHDNGDDRFLRCSFLLGQVQTCETGGDWPGSGTDFEHVCTVTWPEPLPVAGDEGGLTEWGCLVDV